MSSSPAVFVSCGTIRQKCLSRVPRCNPGGSLKARSLTFVTLPASAPSTCLVLSSRSYRSSSNRRRKGHACRPRLVSSRRIAGRDWPSVLTVWFFWLVLVAFLFGVLRLPASALQLAGTMPASGPTWYEALQGVIGVVQFLIAIAMVAGYRKAGVWGEF